MKLTQQQTALLRANLLIPGVGIRATEPEPGKWRKYDERKKAKDPEGYKARLRARKRRWRERQRIHRIPAEVACL